MIKKFIFSDFTKNKYKLLNIDIDKQNKIKNYLTN